MKLWVVLDVLYGLVVTMMNNALSSQFKMLCFLKKIGRDT